MKFPDKNQLIEYNDNIAISVSFICEPEKCKTQILYLNSHIRILQQNIGSINKNFPSIPMLLSRLNFKCDIVLSECWLQFTSNLPNLHGSIKITALLF